MRFLLVFFSRFVVLVESFLSRFETRRPNPKFQIYLARSLARSLSLSLSRTLSSFVNRSSCKTMASKPLTTEAIALTEKKMDMTLEDIIKMSKSNPPTPKKQRVSNRSQKFLNTGAQAKSSKVQRFMDSRSSMRQGVLAQRRSNFQGNQFPMATEAARKAAVAPIRNRAFNRGRVLNVNKPRVRAPPVQRKTTNGSFIVKPQPQLNVVPKQRPQTLDSRFANMKEQRMRALSQQNNGGRQNGGGLPRQQWGRGRFGN